MPVNTKHYGLALAGILLSSLLMAVEPETQSFDDRLALIKQKSNAGGCFYIHTLDSYRVLDKYHVLVYAPSHHKPWLLEFGNACPLLRQGETIMLEGSHGQVCGNAGDVLRTRNQNCGIAKIRSITSEDADSIKALSR